MEGINSIFQKNSFTSYPAKAETQCKKIPKDIFEKKDNTNELTSYLDILYSDNDNENFDSINTINLFKIYSPIKSQKLHFGKFYL